MTPIDRASYWGLILLKAGNGCTGQFLESFTTVVDFRFLEGAEAVSSSLHGQQTKVSSGFLLRENAAIEVTAAPEAPGG